MKSGTGLPQWPSKAGSLCLCPLSSSSGCIVMCWCENLVTQTSHFASAAIAAQPNKRGSKLQTPLAMSEEKTAKVKPFQVFVCVCVCVSPLSLFQTRKNLIWLMVFKICSPNFTLFKNGLKSLYSLTVTKTKQKQTKKAFLSRGATQINPALKGLDSECTQLPTWLQDLGVYVQNFNSLMLKQNQFSKTRRNSSLELVQRQLVSYSKYSKLEYSNYKKYRREGPWVQHLHEDGSRDGGTSTVALLRGPLFGVGLLRQFSMPPCLPDTLPHIWLTKLMICSSS